MVGSWIISIGSVANLDNQYQDFLIPLATFLNVYHQYSNIKFSNNYYYLVYVLSCK